jgi:hypothetical protein
MAGPLRFRQPDSDGTGLVGKFRAAAQRQHNEFEIHFQYKTERIRTGIGKEPPLAQVDQGDSICLWLLYIP